MHLSKAERRTFVLSSGVLIRQACAPETAIVNATNRPEEIS